MKNWYVVSFLYDKDVYCTNLCIADSKEQTEEHYSKEFEWVSVIRVVDHKDGAARKRISPIFIMPEYRNKGYAQQAIIEAERIYGEHHWKLDTILQEKGNCYLYEKLGYHRTGKFESINDKMDIVYYEKD